MQKKINNSKKQTKRLQLRLVRTGVRAGLRRLNPPGARTMGTRL